MAVRKSPRKTSSKPAAKSRTKTAGKGPGPSAVKQPPWAAIFWLGFAIVIIGLFLFNRETISESIQTIKNEVAGREKNQELPVTEPAVETETRPVVTVTTAPAAKPAAEPKPTPEQKPASGQTTQPAAQTPTAQTPTAQTPAVQTAPVQSVPQQNPPQTGQTETRERALYFIHVDRGGSILREKVSRKIPVSDSPMTDTVRALITGPSNEEKNKGLITLVPQNTRILSATVRGDTAYLSFSEDFQYNTYGVEGYAGQLRQVVFTVTEFPNIKYVQILIEGRRVDYLGEGIWIGSPLSRDML